MGICIPYAKQKDESIHKLFLMPIRLTRILIMNQELYTMFSILETHVPSLWCLHIKKDEWATPRRTWIFFNWQYKEGIYVIIVIVTWHKLMILVTTSSYVFSATCLYILQWHAITFRYTWYCKTFNGDTT